MSLNLESKPSYVGKLLRDENIFSVPGHQREFAWKKEHIEQYWEDIESSRKSDQEYFLGAVVLKRVALGSYEVIDGQQRIVTTLNLLAAIREISRPKFKYIYDYVKQKFFGEINPITENFEQKLVLNRLNNNVFVKCICNEISIEEVRKELDKSSTIGTNKLLLGSYLFFHDIIKRKVKSLNKDDEKQYLNSIIKFLMEKLQIIVIIVSDESDAYILFEALNERGLVLSLLDLVKNHLFAKSSRDGEIFQIVNDNWIEAKFKLDESKGLNYIRHLWISKHGNVRKQVLFKKIKEDIDSADSAKKFAEDFNKNASTYMKFYYPNHNDWSGYGDRAAFLRNSLLSLLELNASQSYPVLLSAYNNLNDDEFVKITYQMVVMAVRYGLIGEKKPSTLETLYCEIAHKIYVKEIVRSSGVANELKALYPSDEQFSYGFKNKTIPQPKQARFILRSIENYLSGGEKVINEDVNKLNLEHILPQRSSGASAKGSNGGEWESAEMRKEYVNRIGNMTLINSAHNKEIGNKKFNDKISVYKKSECKITQEIAKYKKWTRAEIEERQADLADVAIKIWQIEQLQKNEEEREAKTG